MFKGLHQKYLKKRKKKDTPSPSPRSPLVNNSCIIKAFKCHTCFKKKNPCVEIWRTSNMLSNTLLFQKFFFLNLESISIAMRYSMSHCTMRKVSVQARLRRKNQFALLTIFAVSQAFDALNLMWNADRFTFQKS